MTPKEIADKLDDIADWMSVQSHNMTETYPKTAMRMAQRAEELMRCAHELRKQEAVPPSLSQERESPIRSTAHQPNPADAYKARIGRILDAQGRRSEVERSIRALPRDDEDPFRDV